MTDRYPPFRLDMGGHDPGTVTVPPGPPEVTAQLGTPGGRPGWTAGRIVLVVAGSVLVLVSLGLLGGGGTALWAQTHKQGGYLDLGTTSYTSPGYAIASSALDMHTAGGWDAASSLLGTVRIRVTPGATNPAFVGIAPATAAERYLAGVAYSTVTGRSTASYAGAAPAIVPTAAGIWTAQATGPGSPALTWAAHSGDWMVVAMNADGSRPVIMRVNLAATLPALPWVAAGLLIGGFVFLAAGVALVTVPLRNARHDR
jgi:hypothetical protein